MFRKKKTAFQMIADRWDHCVDMHISEKAKEKAEALKNVIMFTVESAAMINNRKAYDLSKKGAFLFQNLLRGSFLIGYDYQQTTEVMSSFILKINHLPTEVIPIIEEVRHPLIDVIIKLVDISHSPGRIVLLEENKDMVRDGLINAVNDVSLAYFLEGARRS